MKAVCKTCGKKFDPEKTDFLCPKCGAWYITGNHYDIGNENNQGTIYDCDDCDHESMKVSKEPKCHDAYFGEGGQTWNSNGSNGTNQTWGSNESDNVDQTFNSSANRRTNQTWSGNESNSTNQTWNTTGDNGSKKVIVGPNGDMTKEAKKVIGLAAVIIIIVSIGIVAISVFMAMSGNYDDEYYDNGYYDGGYYGDGNYDDGYYDSDDGDGVSDDGMGDNGGGSNDYVGSDYDKPLNIYDKGSDLNVMDYSYGEAIAGLNGDMGILLTVDEPVIVDSEELDIPEGCVLYRVHYKYINPDGYDYDYGYSMGAPELYMYTKSGDFLRPLNDGERFRLFSYDQDKYVEMGEGRSGVYEGEGNLFFVTTNVDYDYLVVYDMVDETEIENQTEEMICLVGSPLQKMEWSGIPENSSNTSGFIFDIHSLPYIEKVEPGTVVDLPVYKNFDLIEYAADNDLPNVDEYDCYVVGMNLVNYTDKTLSFPYITGINFDSGEGASLSQIKYYENEEQYIPPASMATRYYLVFMPKDTDPTLTITFFNSKADDMSITLMNEHTFTLK